jgi:tellurite resistance protein TerC
MWTAFWIIVVLALFIDLAVMNKHHGSVSIKEALTMVFAWVSLAALFGGAIWLFLGHVKGLEYFTGYVIEYSLSIDNMFVFIMIFSYFAVPAEHQPKVLLWGILGAVVMRFVFIFIGVQLIIKFKFMVYIFGALLIYTAIKMLVQKEEKFDPGKMPILKLFKKIMPLKDTYENGKFFIKENSKWFATTLFAAVLVIEGSDLIFAVDSIPAVLSITRDTFIVYTSNIFAIIGLRSLYFLLSGMAGKFEYLKYGIAVVLIFVGVKMIISHYYHIPTPASLGVIAFVLGAAILPSAIKNKMDTEK